MKKVFTILAMALALGVSAFAEEAPAEAVQTSSSHFKFYGFIRTYFAFDTRESSAGTEDLYFYMPKDQNIVNGVDLNAVPSFRFAALTSRAGVDVTGYEVGGYKVGAKIEADFYCGVSGVTGTAQLRLRQAYATIAKGGRSWKIGQAWHPMAADLPDIFSLESGAPFGPFSRTPQVNFECKLDKNLSLTAAAIWQMQYTSTGPSLTKGSNGVYDYATAAASANYIKYGIIPELYLGVNYKWDSNILRFGADMLSIKPRNYNYNLITGKPINKVNDRITTFNFFQYGQFKLGDWTLREKITFANDGSHFNMVGGYGVSYINADGSWNYTATRNLSGWMTAQYKPKGANWVPAILLGYIKDFGTGKDIVGDFWCKNSASSVSQMFRIQPEVVYNFGKLAFGLEYMVTAAQYGKCNTRKQVVDDLHWVANNRIQVMVKYTF